MGKKIGAVSKALDISIDTLRYYEKLGLLGKVPRTQSGIRLYSAENIKRTAFVQRAQAMSFSLKDIGELLVLRDQTSVPKPEVRSMIDHKISEINQRLDELSQLRDELKGLRRLCKTSSGDSCPIIKALEK